jgi:hypothetical protein
MEAATEFRTVIGSRGKQFVIEIVEMLEENPLGNSSLESSNEFR